MFDSGMNHCLNQLFSMNHWSKRSEWFVHESTCFLFSSDSMIRSQHADVKDVKKAFIFVFIEAKESNTSYTHMSVSSYLVKLVINNKKNASIINGVCMIPARLSKSSEVMIAVCEEQNFSKYSLKTLICSNSKVWFLWIKFKDLNDSFTNQIALVLKRFQQFTADSTDDWMWNSDCFSYTVIIWIWICNLARYGEFIIFVWSFYWNCFLFCVPLRKESNASYTNTTVE